MVGEYFRVALATAELSRRKFPRRVRPPNSIVADATGRRKIYTTVGWWSLKIKSDHLKMPRPCAVELHVSGYNNSGSLEDATGLSRGVSR